MTRRKYYLPKQYAPVERTEVLCDVNVKYIPSVLRAIEHIKGRAFWSDEVAAERAYREMCLFQWGLLMSSGEFIVNNIIAARGIDPAAPRDAVYGTPLAPAQGTSLLDVFGTLQGPRGTPGAALDAIASAAELGAQNTATGLGVGDADGLLLELLLLAL